MILNTKMLNILKISAGEQIDLNPYVTTYTSNTALLFWIQEKQCCYGW